MMRSIGVMIVPALLLAQQGPSLGTSPEVAQGEQLFAQGCAVAACHGPAGAAAKAERLRGRSFEREYLLRVIRDGIANTAMPAWGDRLRDDEIEALATYIQSLTVLGAEPEVPAEGESAAEVRQGRELFFDTQRRGRCASCHRLQGLGTPVGSDLARLPRQKLDAAAIDILKYGRARSVRTVILKDGARIPAIVIERKTEGLRLYDLAATPPVERSLLAGEVRSILAGSNWRHGRAVRAYSPDDLQAVWMFVRWAAEQR